jgi:hemerythrin-like domain-containing protein
MIRQPSLWREEQAAFRMLLSMLERELAAFERGAAPDHGLMADVVSYLHQHAERAHHHCEELAFDRLIDRDPSLAVLLGRLRQEHRVLAASGSELLGRLGELESDVVVSREPVESAAATFLVYYRHHLAAEERDFLPRAQALLTPDDWAEVAAAAGSGPDPLFGDPPGQRFAELRRRIDRENGSG